MYTSSEKQPPEVVCKKDVLKNFESFTEKHLCWSFFLTKLQAWRPATLFKKTLTQMFLRNFLKFKSDKDDYFKISWATYCSRTILDTPQQTKWNLWD